uniref:F-box domain-containing protein n=1 Tax=Leersia perrieri TaxID=77586 RepID=A0A0D9XHN9_9ORYZ
MAEKVPAASTKESVSPPPPQPIPYLPATVLQNSLLCLAPEPAHLAKAMAVSKRWRSTVHCEKTFGRVFRQAYLGPPPVLGLVSNSKGTPFFTPAAGTRVVGLTPPEEAVSHDEGGRAVKYVYDARHGRVLMDSSDEKALIVWNPLSGGRDIIEMPPDYFLGDGFGGAVICDADHAAGDDCHAARYRVVFAYGGRLAGRRCRTLACVYSSSTKTWGPVASMDGYVSFNFKPTAVLNKAVYWLITKSTGILQLDLETNTLTLFTTPVDLPDFVIFPMADGRLGYAGMMGPFVRVFAVHEIHDSGLATWVDVTTIHLDAMRPDFDEASASEPDSGAEFDEEMVVAALLLARRIAPKEGNIRSIIPPCRACVTDTDNQEYKFAVIRPRVVGFLENPCSVLVQNELGTYMVFIESNEHKRLSQSIHFTTVYPYTSFHTSGMMGMFVRVFIIDETHDNGVATWMDISTIHLDVMRLDFDEVSAS